MIFWLVLKLGISYRIVILGRSLFKGIFLKIIFLHHEILEFP
jgi:hypothetical protein